MRSRGLVPGIPRGLVKAYTTPLFVVGLVGACLLGSSATGRTDEFGSGPHVFTIDFVHVGDPGNPADASGYGSVPYEFRMGTHEISADAVLKAAASGLDNVTAASNWTGNRPAAGLTWYEAAAFVNWLNTSTGHRAAYNLTWNGSDWVLELWSSQEAWQAGGENRFRHKDARYFLPSENEWFKAAYYSPDASSYSIYATGGNIEPIAVASGTDADTAVYAQPFAQGTAEVTLAGGLSPFGTMGQSGNLWEWMETAFDGINDSSAEDRPIRGGDLVADPVSLSSSTRIDLAPTYSGADTGFRVGSVPGQ
jgi:formylglycine-generating enzyme required for sulfatase activity